MSSNPPPKTDSSASSRPRRRASAEERREQILQAAFSCFAEKGYHAATMDDLARASGLSKGSLYWHFRSKEEVFIALFDAFSAQIYRQWDAAAQSGAEAPEVLRRECEIAVDVLSNDRVGLRAWAEFINHPAGRERMADVYATSRRKLAATIERGRGEGSLCEGPAAEEVAGVLVGMIEGMLLQWLVDPEFEPRRHVATAWEVMMGGLRA
ncbi:MAG: TetR/AcrR family transcriptional regulator [bacterium]|nr:TetR/AcrR family transcriptional regulator [bacterium]